MKATDLMIGDWVQSFGEPHKIIGIRTDTPYPYIKTNMSDTWYEWGMKDLADGIPLTPEILKKNADKIDMSYQFGEYPKTMNVMYDSRARARIMEGDDEYYGIVLNYVHELQHALRLFGVEKEIEL